MNKLFRKTRGGQSRTLASTDDPLESSDDAAKLPVTDAADQQQATIAAVSSETGGGSETFDVVLRLEVPPVPKLRSSSIDASCLHQGEMNADNVYASAATGSGGTAGGGRGSCSPTGSDASLADREPGALAPSATSSSSLLRVDLPKCFRRRSLEVPRLCIHCVHLEAMAGRDDSPSLSPAASSDAAGPDSRCSSPSDADGPYSTSDDEELHGDSTVDIAALSAAFDMESTPSHAIAWQHHHHQQQQRMLHSDERQKFFLTSPDSQAFPVVTTTAAAAAATDTYGETDSVNGRGSSGGGSNRSSVGSGDGCTATNGAASGGAGGSTWKEIVTLQVPLIKPRSSSLDVTYYASTLRPPDDGDDDRRCSCENLTLPDSAKHRSTSVDVNLPTDASGGSYRAITCYATDSNK